MGLSTERCPVCGTELSETKFKEIQLKLRAEEQKKSAVIRQQLEQQFKLDMESQSKALEKKVRAEVEGRVKQLSSERDQLAKQVKQAAENLESARKRAIEEAEKKRQTDLAQQRLSLETDKKMALLKQQSEFNRSKEAFQKKVQLMEKQLQNKTANELGDGAEIDLYETLREQFQSDRITRVPKGQAGADIIHEILYKGASCGKIAIDCKNRQSWQNSYVTKLRQDQGDVKAEHAILATTVFPTGKKEMCIESDVIVVSPARVVHIVHLLRNALITMHIKGLSNKERATKMTRLYKLITSEAYSQKFAEADKLTDEILELDVQEKKAHDNIWKRRGSMTKRIQNVLREVETDVAAVIEGGEDEETAPPAFAAAGVRKTPPQPRAQGGF
jgi:hypothetical protein